MAVRCLRQVQKELVGACAGLLDLVRGGHALARAICQPTGKTWNRPLHVHYRDRCPRVVLFAGLKDHLERPERVISDGFR